MNEEKILAACVSLFIGLMTGLVMKGCEESNRLMKQCIDDGKKEYECKSILTSRSSPNIVPMPIIIRR